MPEIGIDIQLHLQVPLGGEMSAAHPIGERIIGLVDPRTLLEADFRSSPDLLFHGAREEFDFFHGRDYAVTSSDYSQTIGRGFYTTDDRDNATFYSRIRMGGLRQKHIVVEILPYQARVFDLRSADNQRVNAPVPSAFVQEYVAFMNNVFVTLPEDAVWHLRSHLTEYLSTLRRLVREGKPIDLRAMLSIRGDPNASEFAAGYFTQFMRGKGFDGLVYNEGGDHPDQKHTTSYVFYNPQKIGSYQSWHA